ncbi:MAG: MarR family winged helix-turn-helix transcriptional regulator [Flavobacteriales bacterium]
MIKENLNEVVLFLIDQTSKMARQYSQKEFDLLNLEITVEQWILLKLVDQHEGKTQGEIANISFRDPASISRTLDILEKKGMIRRGGVKESKKKKIVQLTKEGKYFILQTMPLIDHMRSKGIKGLSQTEVESLMNLLLRMQKNYGFK